MPAVKTKQYLIGMANGQKITGFSPQNDYRVSLTIQNTGIGTALIRFDNDVQLDGGDLLLLPGQLMQWNDPNTCPRERLNSYSVDGTTLAVIEGTLPR